MIIEISAAVAALAFVALVIYLIAMIKSLQQTLTQANEMLVEVRKQIDGLGGEAKKIIEQAHLVSADLKEKSETLNPLFYAAKNLGQFLEHKTFALKEEFLASSFEETDLSDVKLGEKKKTFKSYEVAAIANILELVGIGLRLWQKFNRRR